MDQVFITDLVARGIIGVNDWEREQPQDILINIVLFTDLHQAGQSDDVHDSVDYRSVAKKVLAHAETARRLTVKRWRPTWRSCAWKWHGWKKYVYGWKSRVRCGFPVGGGRDRTGKRISWMK